MAVTVLASGFVHQTRSPAVSITMLLEFTETAIDFTEAELSRAVALLEDVMLLIEMVLGHAEQGGSAGAIAERDVNAAGHDVDVLSEGYSDTMGHAGAVVMHKSGILEGGHDPRADGGAAGA